MNSETPASPFSSPFHDYSSWTAADMIVCSGAVAIDIDSKKVLLLRDKDGSVYLPWCQDTTDNVGTFFESPFGQIEKETGYRFEKLPCRRPRRFARPQPDNPNHLCSVVNLGSQATVDPCYISFDVHWTKTPETGKWYDSRQRMTLWFICTARATDGVSRAKKPAVWMTLPEARARLATQGRRSLPDQAVLKQLDFMWLRK